MGHKAVKLDNDTKKLLNEVRAMILNKNPHIKVTDNNAIKKALEHYKKTKR